MTSENITNTSQQKERKFITALARGLEVLSCFSAGERFLGNNQIAERTGLPKSTVSRLTYTLRESGYLLYVPSLNRYRLGAKLLNLSYSLLAQMEIRQIARPLMQALAEHTQLAINLGVRDHLNMVYVDTYRNASTYAVQLDIGSQLPIATTSMGRAYLAVISEQKRLELMEEIRVADEQNWPKIKEAVEQSRADYREKGFCLSLGDWRKEVHAVAVPLIPNDGSEIMIFSCSGASFQLGSEIIEKEIGPRLLNLAGNVKTALNHV
ncbi:MAG: IclR family transcriptional regulator [Proteobacteria bacterium]|nr:IclR family transcriptional regulator [Pseudomonadota bacterium]